jgi:hypothetical protein
MSEGTKVRRELDPGELTADDGREAAYRERLRDAWHTLQQAVPLGEQCHHELLDHVFLPDDDSLDLSYGVAE